MPMITFQVEVSDETLRALLEQVSAGPRPLRAANARKATSRLPSFHEGTPEWEGDYAHLYKTRLRSDLWEMIYAAAKAYGTRPFTLEDLAAELGVETEEIRKRMRALGRSRLISEILAAQDDTYGELGREDAMPWMRSREADGRWVYRFWPGGKDADEPSVAERVIAEGR